MLHGRWQSLGSPIRLVAAVLSILLLTGPLLLFATGTASAHGPNELTASEPPAHSTVSEAPKRVVLNFKWRVRPGSAVVTVLGPDGRTEWQHGKPGELDNSVGVDLRQLDGAGHYEIRYSGLSKRGHPFQGSTGFNLAAGVAGGGGLPMAWVAGVVLITALATTVGVQLNRRLP